MMTYKNKNKIETSMRNKKDRSTWIKLDKQTELYLTHYEIDYEMTGFGLVSVEICGWKFQSDFTINGEVGGNMASFKDETYSKAETKTVFAKF